MIKRILIIAAVLAVFVFVVNNRQSTAVDFSKANQVAKGISDTFVSQAEAQTPIVNQTGQTLTVTATTTGAGAMTLLAAPSTGVRNYITQVQCVNTSASTQAVASIKSGSTTIWYVGCPPASVNQGIVVFSPPLRQPDTATSLTMTMSAAATTAYMNMSGFTAK